MKRILFSLAFVVLAVTFGVAQKPRDVQIEVTLPNGAHPLLKIVEGGTASIEIPKVAKFGFVPTVKAGDSDTLVVQVLDLSKDPAQKLDTIETSIRGAAVTAKTDPQIAIRATYIQRD